MATESLPTDAGDPRAGEAAPRGGSLARAAAPPSPLVLIVGALVLLALALWGLGRPPLVEPDDARYAEIPREMLASGDLVTPRLEGVLYFEKPPLHYWLTAGSLHVLGGNELGARLPSALAGLGALLLAFLLGRDVGGVRTGALAALVLGTGPLPLLLAHVSIIDTTTSVTIGATLLAFWLAHRRPPDGARRLLWLAVFAAAALAVLAKGLIGVVLPGGVIFFYLLLTRQWRVLRQVPWVGGPLLFLLVAAPWHVLMAQRHPSFLWFYFVHEHLLRYATKEAARTQPFWFFVPVVLIGLLPWTAMLPAALRLLREEDRGRRQAVQFLAVWAGLIVLFFSLSQSKLATYVLPALVPLAVLLALAIVESARLRPGLVRGGIVVATLLLALIAAALGYVALGRVPQLLPEGGTIWWGVVFGVVGTLAALLAAVRARGTAVPLAAIGVAAVATCAAMLTLTPAVALGRSTRGLVPFLRQRLAAGDELIVFGSYPESLGFYLGRQVPAVGYHGELEWGIAQLPAAERLRRFPSTAEYAPHWRGPRRIYALVRDRSLPRMRSEGLPTGPVIGHEGSLRLVSNDPAAPAPTGSVAGNEPPTSRRIP